MAINIVDLFKLMYTSSDVDLGGLFTLFQVQVMLVVTPNNLHILVHLGCSSIIGRLPLSLAIKTAHIYLYFKFQIFVLLD